MHAHTGTTGVSKINVVTPVRNLGQFPQLLSHPPTSHLSPGSIATTSKVPLTLVCPSPIPLLRSSSNTGVFSHLGFISGLQLDLCPALSLHWPSEDSF